MKIQSMITRKERELIGLVEGNRIPIKFAYRQPSWLSLRVTRSGNWEPKCLAGRVQATNIYSP